VILNAEIPETVPFPGMTLHLIPPVFAPAHFNEINKIKNARNLKNILQKLTKTIFGNKTYVYGPYIKPW